MKKRILASILTIAMVVSILACLMPSVVSQASSTKFIGGTVFSTYEGEEITLLPDYDADKTKERANIRDGGFETKAAFNENLQTCPYWVNAGMTFDETDAVEGKISLVVDYPKITADVRGEAGFMGVYLAPCFEGEAYCLEFYTKLLTPLEGAPSVMIYFFNTDKNEEFMTPAVSIGTDRFTINAETMKDSEWEEQKWIRVRHYFVVDKDSEEQAFSMQIQNINMNVSGETTRVAFDAFSLKKVSIDKEAMDSSLFISDLEPDKKYNVGDKVVFGNYWQNDTNGSGKADQNDDKEPIEWRVLSQNGDELFLLAEQGLDCQPYNTTRTSVAWETCTLRTWLNDDFYDNAFSSSEQNAIKTTTLVNEDNPMYGTEGGNNTNDKVFLLSYSDVTNSDYGFSANDSTGDINRQKIATEYTKDCDVWVSTDDEFMDKCYWWLRSPGDDSVHAARVRFEGYVNDSGANVNNMFHAVCPAIRVDLSKIGQATGEQPDIEGPSVKPTSPPTNIPVATPSSTPTLSPIPTSSPTQSIGDYQYKVKNDGTIEIIKYLGNSKVVQIPTKIDGHEVTSIGDRAFANNDILQNVFMPENLETIGERAFDSCLSLANVGFNANTKVIGAYAFYNCPALSMAALPENVSQIGKYAFGYDSANKPVFGFYITGYSGTVAETYANENGLTFTSVGEGSGATTKKKVTLKFTKKSVKIKRGKKVTLKVKLTGAKKAKFSVDKKGKKVVKLSKKKAKSVVVTGKKKGKATITAKAAGKKAKCKVTVK